MSAMENGRATHGPSKKEKNKTDNRSSGRSRKPVEIEQVDGATLHGSLVAEAKYDLEYDSSLDKAMSDVRYGERSIVGNFTCKYCRPSHPRTWASGVISTELWLARNSNLNRYRAMLHSQKCKRCNRYAEPEVDIDNYVRKVISEFDLWKGLRLADYRDPCISTAPHDIERCHGCKIGICRKGKQREGYEREG